jgi:2-phospho-L-lactate guanylyltransferase
MAPSEPTALVALPVRSFHEAKGRLAGEVDPDLRTALAEAMAARCATAARRAGAQVVVVTADPAVVRWARSIGIEVLHQEDHLPGLDGAAALAARTATGRDLAWAILHADMPLVTAASLAAALAGPGPKIAPSYDGGTNLLVGTGPAFPFAYGPGSFARHLRAAPAARVVIDHHLACDLDRPEDLARLGGVPGGDWLQPLLAGALR